MTEQEIDEIVIDVQHFFATFGGIAAVDYSNPISAAMKARRALFALGVDVKDVVKFIVGEVDARNTTKSKKKISSRTTTGRFKTAKSNLTEKAKA